MKSTFLIITIFSFLIFLPSTTFCLDLLEKSKESKWSEMIGLDGSNGQNPKKYYLCGLSFQEMMWTQILYNCNCRIVELKSIFGTKKAWQCDWCDNVMWTKSNGLRATFCEYKNWTSQINSTFLTGNNETRSWRNYKCPEEYYVSSIANNFGSEYGTYLGCNGAKIQCKNIKTGSILYISDILSYQLTAFPQVQNQQYISSLKVKYEVNGTLLDAVWFWQKLPAEPQKPSILKPNATHYFKCVATGRVLDSNGAGSVYTLGFNGGDYQIWITVDAGDGLIYLKNKATGRVLDSNPQKNIYTLPLNGGNFQKWKYESFDGNAFKLINFATGFVLDSNSAGSAYTNDYNGGDYQRYTFTPI